MKHALPIVTAIHFAHAVRVDSVSNYDLIGLLSKIESANFPIVMPKLAIFLQMTDGRGRLPIKIRLREVETDCVLWAEEHVVNWGEPSYDCVLHRSLQNIAFPNPGIYMLEVLSRGELFAAHSLRALKVAHTVAA